MPIEASDNWDVKVNKQEASAKQSDDADFVSRAESSLLMKVIRTGLINTEKYNILIQRKDPSSPFYSVKTFEGLHLKSELLKGLYSMGFNSPSKIQETTLPTILANPPQNMIAQSQSGTGKTVAFVLAMLSRVDTTLNYPHILCLAPTYELAIQIGEVAANMGRYCEDIKMKYAVRGEEFTEKCKEHILIGTPGKVLDWSLKYRLFDLTKIRVFVLDEADVMIDIQGHHDQCIRIHKQLSKKDCQMLFFSATYNKDIMDFAEYIVNHPNIIRLTRREEVLKNIKQYVVKCNDADAKYSAITNIYGGITIGQAIIFCQTRKHAAWLAGKMSQDGHSVALLTGELNVTQRLSVLDRYRAGLEKVLIATNVLCRGIDVEQVTLVVNFDLPLDANHKPDCENYLHRIGRTGRYGRQGIAINLVANTSQDLLVIEAFEKHFEEKIPVLNTDDVEAIEALEQ